jgi:hypothetical protein
MQSQLENQIYLFKSCHPEHEAALKSDDFGAAFKHVAMTKRKIPAS